MPYRFDLDLSDELARLPLQPGAQILPLRAAESAITYHYSGVPTADRSRAAELALLVSEARYHIAKDWGGNGSRIYGDGIMYDVAVLSDGAVVRLRDTRRQLWHCGNASGNATSWSVHTALGPGQELTDPQRASLFRLFDELREDRIGRGDVFGHCDWPRRQGLPQAAAVHRALPGQSICPGPTLYRHVVDYRAGGRGGQADAGETIRLDRYSELSPILGRPLATLAHALRYVLGRPGRGDYSAWDLAQVILPAYFEQALAVGIDPILAIAQAIHETGNFSSYWAARPRRNPAGIGVTGQAGAGVSFATWNNDAIPAHLGRLLAYALPRGGATSTQEALIQKALSYRPLPAHLRGTASTLAPLGARRNPTGQGWANPGDQYGAAIARIANAIVDTPL